MEEKNFVYSHLFRIHFFIHFLYIVSPIKAIHFLKIIKFSKSNLDTIARSLRRKFYYTYYNFKSKRPNYFLTKKPRRDISSSKPLYFITEYFLLLFFLMVMRLFRLNRVLQTIQFFPYVLSEQFLMLSEFVPLYMDVLNLMTYTFLPKLILLYIFQFHIIN